MKLFTLLARRIRIMLGFEGLNSAIYSSIVCLIVSYLSVYLSVVVNGRELLQEAEIGRRPLVLLYGGEATLLFRRAVLLVSLHRVIRLVGTEMSNIPESSRWPYVLPLLGMHVSVKRTDIALGCLFGTVHGMDDMINAEANKKNVKVGMLCH